jgi:hypothetical protein
MSENRTKGELTMTARTAVAEDAEPLATVGSDALARLIATIGEGALERARVSARSR